MYLINRDQKVDILRAIALIGIFIAHSKPNTFLFQLRSFDVPLMVLLMGMSFYISNKDKEVSHKEYIIKRVKRILVPTWVFLTIFFILFFVISLILNQKYYFDLKHILLSYTFISGIGYVWIIQVFLAVAIASPFILKISKKIKSNKKYIMILTFSYIIYSILVYFGEFLNGELHNLYEHIILYNIGYIIIAALGIRFKEFTNKEIKKYIIFFMIILIVLMFVNNFQLTNVAKYPPTMYYISYALLASFLMYLLLDNKFIFNLLNNKIVSFISENSFWIYLWHIIPIYIIQLFNFPIISNKFIGRFLFIFISAIVLTIIHNVVKLSIDNLYIKEKYKTNLQ